MSGSGGFYKYHCRNFYTYNCKEWVLVNNSFCPKCCSEGRGEDGAAPDIPSRRPSRDICVPRVEDGILSYTLMEIVNMDESGNQWTLRYKGGNQTQASTIMTTSAIPGPPVPAITR
ncbi:hypothetical protein F4779DRAFT_502015 [Xylariaceae sp. FL0662B]|nr:hypothetical protein F4779DRAFT_502015 [Xylariaceae sp. FL0662B]